MQYIIHAVSVATNVSSSVAELTRLCIYYYFYLFRLEASSQHTVEMSYPTPPYSNNQSQDNASAIHQAGLDSITLGQLKAMVGSAPKPKVDPLLPQSRSLS